MDILSRRIKELRIDHDLKQGEMGEALGITQNMVSIYENGESQHWILSLLMLGFLMSL